MNTPCVWTDPTPPLNEQQPDVVKISMGEARECLRGTLDSRPVRRAIKRVQQLCASDPVPVKKFRNRNRAQVAMACNPVTRHSA